MKNNIPSEETIENVHRICRASIIATGELVEKEHGNTVAPTDFFKIHFACFMGISLAYSAYDISKVRYLKLLILSLESLLKEKFGEYK